jgi:hypothetical protein
VSEQRNLLGDAVSALVVLLGLDVATLPEEPAAMRTALQRAAFEERLSWERLADRDRDHDAATRARRWARAVEAAWELARHELDVASGRRRAGWAA